MTMINSSTLSDDECLFVPPHNGPESHDLTVFFLRPVTSCLRAQLRAIQANDILAPCLHQKA